ncbi:hypothetical protein V8E53_002920 [Lactarius tabidus]
MGRCLYSFSPSHGQYLPLVSGNVTSVCSAAPSPFAEQPANLHSGFLATRGGDPPATAFGVDVITCQWADCCAAFDDFSMFISHVQEDHTGVHKSNYTCEWVTCTDRGIPQTSRFALISHLRSHTSEKTLACELPECDQSFTSTNGLANCMCLQHNFKAGAPGPSSGHGKQKHDCQVPSYPTATDPAGFSSLKVRPSMPCELHSQVPAKPGSTITVTDSSSGAVTCSSGGNGKVARDAYSEQPRLPDFSNLAWIWIW